jgi:hypothetical protein
VADSVALTSVRYPRHTQRRRAGGPRSWLGANSIVTAGECFVFPQRRPGAAERHWKRLQMLFRRGLDRSTDEERCH